MSIPYSIRCHACGRYGVSYDMIYYKATSPSQVDYVTPQCSLKQQSSCPNHWGNRPDFLVSIREKYRVHTISFERAQELPMTPINEALPYTNAPLVPKNPPSVYSKPKPTNGFKPKQHTVESLLASTIHLNIKDHDSAAFLIGLKQMYGMSSIAEAVHYCINIMLNNSRLPNPFQPEYADNNRPVLPVAPPKPEPAQEEQALEKYLKEMFNTQV